MVKNDVGANVEGFASGIAYVGEADAVGSSGERVLVGKGRFLLVDIYASTGDAALLKAMSTTLPRAVLIRMAEGFIRAMRSLLMRW